VNIIAALDASVRARLHEEEILVVTVYLLQLENFLKHHIVHTMFIAAKYALGFNAYFHSEEI
jgi:hypothetical protein